MNDEPRLKFTRTQRVSTGSLCAPACPVEARANWVQITLSLAISWLFLALTVGAFTKSPISSLGGTLAGVGFLFALFVLMGLLRTRFGGTATLNRQ